MRLVIVRDLAIGEDHAVVAARVDDNWIVLDNRRLALVEDSDMQRVVPLFVLRSRRRQAVHARALAAGTPRGWTPRLSGRAR